MYVSNACQVTECMHAYCLHLNVTSEVPTQCALFLNLCRFGQIRVNLKRMICHCHMTVHHFGQIFFIGEKSAGGTAGVTMVFNLKSTVKSFRRSEVCASVFSTEFIRKTCQFSEVCACLFCDSVYSQEISMVRIVCMCVFNRVYAQEVSMFKCV